MYGREIDGRALTLAPSGWTYPSGILGRDTFVLFDRETGTLWFPERNGLLGIQGPLAGRRLPKLPSDDTRWDSWLGAHPGSLVVP